MQKSKIRNIILILTLLINFANAKEISTISIDPFNTIVDLAPNLKYMIGEKGKVTIPLQSKTTGATKNLQIFAHTSLDTPYWLLIGIKNNSNEKIDGLLIANHYHLYNSGLIIPKINHFRLLSISTSSGKAPQKIPSKGTDIFKMSFQPKSEVVLVGEIPTKPISELKLWPPNIFEQYKNANLLYFGIIIGISACLTILSAGLFFTKFNILSFLSTIWCLISTLTVMLYGNFIIPFSLLNGFNTNLLYAMSECLLLIIVITISKLCLFNLTKFSNKIKITISYVTLSIVLLLITIAMPSLTMTITRVCFGILYLSATVAIGYFMIKHKKYTYLILTPIWFFIGLWLFIYYGTILGILNQEFAELKVSIFLMLSAMIFVLTSFYKEFWSWEKSALQTTNNK